MRFAAGADKPPACMPAQTLALVSLDLPRAYLPLRRDAQGIGLGCPHASGQLEPITKTAGPIRAGRKICETWDARNCLAHHHGPQWPKAFTISSVTFLASPKSIIVLSLKNSSFSTPA